MNKITLKDFLEGIDTVNGVMEKIGETKKTLVFTINRREYEVESSEDFYQELSFASTFEGLGSKELSDIKNELSCIEFAEDYTLFDYNGLTIYMKGIK